MVIKNIVKWIGTGICLVLLSAQKKDGEIERMAEVRSVSHRQDHQIRIVLSATERTGGIRYPISTITRDMVKVEFTNTSTPPADAQSLAILGSAPGELKRAVFVGFSFDRKLSARAVTEVRSQISTLVGELPAQYLTVAAISQGSARVVADVTPDNSDNVNNIQQKLASLEPEGEGPAVSDSLCVAAERFHAWNLKDFSAGDQKVLVLLSPMGDGPSTERFRGQNCWRSLIDQGVRVFHISYNKPETRPAFDLAAVAAESGGFVHALNGPLDIYSARKNVVALLRNEYIIDVNAPDIALEDQPLELVVKISYHDMVIATPVFNVGFVMPTLSRVLSNPGTTGVSKVGNQNASDAAPQDVPSMRRDIILSVMFFVLVCGGLSVVVVLRLKKRMATTVCGTCTTRVALDFGDCPFRKAQCVGRLVFIGGPLAGRTLPLMKGPNPISRFAKGGLRLSGSGISWRSHGVLIVDGEKAVYEPARVGRDSINGWPVREARLLGIGHILELGSHKLRFEVKPQFFGKQ